MTTGQQTPPGYRALALQIATLSVGAGQPPAVRQAILRHIARLDGPIGAAKTSIENETGEELRLVVLPEYSLTGAPAAPTVADWRKLAALAPDGPEYAALGGLAERHGIYLAGNAYEADPHFPDLYFQCSFLLGPGGTVLLRYHRLISLYSPTPYDVWDRYLDIYGADQLFPVADTPIGRIAAIASEEILYPEIARCHVMRGAEIFVHSTSEMGMPVATAKELARRARAAENLAYIVSANPAQVRNTALPDTSTTGMSKIIDYEGQIIGDAPLGSESLSANAHIDLAALRARRRQAGLSNVLVRQPFQAYAAAYRQAQFRPANLLESTARRRGLRRSTLEELQAADIDRLAAKKLIG